MNNVQSFQFRNHDLVLDIAGHSFTLDTSKSDFNDRVKAFGQEAIEKAKVLNGKNVGVEALEEAFKFTLQAIDNILGEGSADIIFEGRKSDIFDAIDVLGFVIGKVNEKNTERINEYVGNYTNRAQKRASTKGPKAK